MTTIQIVQLVFDFIVLAILGISSYSDVKTRKVQPIYQIALAVCSVGHFITMSILEHQILWNHLFTGLGVFTIYIAMVLIFKTGIGGADTKMTSLLALYLGFRGTMIMMIAHCVVAILYTIFNKVVFKKTIKSIPLMPFLTAGYVISKIIIWLA
jgi:leader peptidase (prepilin peptidase)/N-methyltransferase